MDWTMSIPLPLLTSAFTDLNKSGGSAAQQQPAKQKEATCLCAIFSVLEFIASAPATTVGMEPAGPGWVPGCPLPDPLAGEDERQVS